MVQRIESNRFVPEGSSRAGALGVSCVCFESTVKPNRTRIPGLARQAKLLCKNCLQIVLKMRVSHRNGWRCLHVLGPVSMRATWQKRLAKR
jgi:hypothetical protein